MTTLNKHGMEPQEEAIMDAWDAGLSYKDIAAETGADLARVDKVVQLFSETRFDRWHLGVPGASDRLLAAIILAHPEVVRC